MKIKSVILGLCSMAILVASCENMGELIPQEYHVILSMQQSGEKDLVLYRTGVDTEYEIAAIKSGSEPVSTAKAKVEAMTEEEFVVYMEKLGKTYKKLPTECFQITGGTLDYTSSDLWKKIKVIINFEKTSQLVSKEKNTYVIPIKMSSESDSVLVSKSELLLKVNDVVVPEVSFTGSKSYVVEKMGGEIMVPMNLQINNMWDFTVRAAIDEESTTLPDVSLADDGMVTFVAGQNGTLKIKIPPFTQNVRGTVGVKILSIEGKDFCFSGEPFKLSVNLTNYPLDASMLDTHAQEPTEGPIADVLDGDINTFFHSRWSEPIPDLHDFIVKLLEPVRKFAFSYTTRAQYAANSAFRKVELWGGDSLEDMHLIKTYTEQENKLPITDATTYYSPMLTLDKPVKVLQWINNPDSGPKFFTMSEFSMQVIE